MMRRRTTGSGSYSPTRLMTSTGAASSGLVGLASVDDDLTQKRAGVGF
jgi:hypothetical protein